MTTLATTQSVFDQALELVHNKAHKDDVLHRWKTKQFSIEDIEQEIQNAVSQYANRSSRKASKWLAKLSEKVMLYAPVMDVFAQLDPQYVCLVWGTTKFLFMLFLNHEESIRELAKSLTKIAMVLPTSSILVDLFSTVHQIRQSAQSIYELLIEHFREMLNFYKEKPWKHVFNNIFKPFRVRFEERLRSIEGCSQSMSRFANALSHRDDRNAHDMQIQLLRYIVDQNQKHFQLSKDHLLVSNDMRIGQMIAAAESSVFKNPADVLNARLALCRRHSAPPGLDVNALWRIRTISAWSVKAQSAFLLIRGSNQFRAHAEFIGTKMVQVVKNRNTPVLFAFQAGRGSKQINTTPSEILQYLLEQALKLNADDVESLVSRDFNAVRVSSATTAGQWAQLLSAALRNLPLVYIYVDLDLISGKDTFEDALSDLISALQQVWQCCPSTTIKVALVSHQRTMSLKNVPAQTSILDIGRIKRR